MGPGHRGLYYFEPWATVGVLTVLVSSQDIRYMWGNTSADGNRVDLKADVGTPHTWNWFFRILIESCSVPWCRRPKSRTGTGMLIRITCQCNTN